MNSNNDPVENYPDEFFVKNYPDSIPKQLNRILQLPPAVTLNNGQEKLHYHINSNVPNFSYYNVKMPLPHFPVSNYNQYNNIFSQNGIISKLAEEKMQPTFKSIETLLYTFNSISTILHSTYSMLYGSFRTITGVADHLIFIRNHMVELALFSRFQQLLIHFLKWLFNLLNIKNLKLIDKLERNNNDKIWNDALELSSTESIKNIYKDNQQSSLWPIFIFFSLVLGTPYIVWRLLGATGAIPKINQPDWTLKNGQHFVAIGLNNFKARNINELSFTKNQMLFIKPETLKPNSKWLLACTSDNKQIQIGLIPLNFVKILNK